MGFSGQLPPKMTWQRISTLVLVDSNLKGPFSGSMLVWERVGYLLVAAFGFWGLVVWGYLGFQILRYRVGVGHQ